MPLFSTQWSTFIIKPQTIRAPSCHFQIVLCAFKRRLKTGIQQIGLFRDPQDGLDVLITTCFACEFSIAWVVKLFTHLRCKFLLELRIFILVIRSNLFDKYQMRFGLLQSMSRSCRPLNINYSKFLSTTGNK